MQGGMRLDEIAVTDTLNVPIEKMAQFKAFEKNATEHTLQKTTFKEYDRLMKLAVNNPKAFLKEDLTTNTLMTEQDRNKLVKVRVGIEGKDERAQKEVSGWAHQDKVMSDALNRGRIFDADQAGSIKERIRGRFADVHANNPKLDTIKDFQHIATEMIDDEVRQGIIKRTPQKQPKVPKIPAAPTFNESTVNAVVAEQKVKTEKVGPIRAAVRQYWAIETGRTKRNMTEADMADITKIMTTPVTLDINWGLDKHKLAGELSMEDAPNGYISALRNQAKAAGQPVDNDAILTIFRMKAAKDKIIKKGY
jgi:hypothetical protein